MAKNSSDDLKSVSNLILNYSLTYLDTKYLKGFRLVCKNWNRKLSPKVFEYLNLIPYSDTAFWRRYKLYYFTPSEIYISTLVKTLANYLHNTKILKISGRFSLNLPTYLNLHFNSVNCMHLNNTTICLTIFSQLTHCLPKLRELRIKNVILEMDSDWELDPKPLLPESLKILNINTFHDYFDFPKDFWFSKNCTESLIITNNAQSILIPFYSKIDSFRELIWKRRFDYGSLGQFESTIDHNPQLDTISLRYHSMLVSTLDNIVSSLPWKKQTIRLDRIKLFANFHTQLETPIYFEFGNLINLTEFKLCFTV
ncbi:hypothetical protein CONCODRAFT_14402 [Conidiobolus coronatus NRRL 28638]|uniref:F-box domain-containing protein n=1 Tax=Conidiobolus coronatus (strain ATCC 28846 / CBS 209.66 / NRRL 28638) TaxID=796925 RepID=A0A137PJ97_CONC2|nr:hypothetical protein CONCODRAFT_14402 [Conidiobolus coronatus NRRL 28638]|eukprot:KXN75073.1 hypothetical protein CONCODRAFT_14402 [Conidiobolus coronatus NRRL 28638]